MFCSRKVSEYTATSEVCKWTNLLFANGVVWHLPTGINWTVLTKLQHQQEYLLTIQNSFTFVVRTRASTVTFTLVEWTCVMLLFPQMICSFNLYFVRLRVKQPAKSLTIREILSPCDNIAPYIYLLLEILEGSQDFWGSRMENKFLA